MSKVSFSRRKALLHKIRVMEYVSVFHCFGSLKASSQGWSALGPKSDVSIFCTSATLQPFRTRVDLGQSTKVNETKSRPSSHKLRPCQD